MRAVRPLSPTQTAHQTVRAQYEGYCAAEGVADNSATPTYAALELHIDNWHCAFSRTKGFTSALRSKSPGSKGPVEVDELLQRNGRLWRYGCLDA